jgi:hypothetical protein
MAKNTEVDRDSVFVNCPFSTDYRPLLECMVFTILACGFRPRSALEASDGGDVRLDKIVRLVKESAYSIHDISVIELDDANKLPRFNMPFELGLVIGCKKLAGRKYASRSLLVLERTRFTYQKCLSDIAGQDTRAHNDSPAVLTRIVRGWLSQESRRDDIPGDRRIFAAFEAFSADLPALCDASGLDYDELSYPDLLGFAQQWLQEHSTP